MYQINKTNEYDVFISYARKDYLDENKVIIPNNPITKLISTFDNSGISYWIDEKGIYSGDTFAKLIANSIKNCKVFLFVSSKASNVSEWTTGEVAIAREYRKKIIPLRLDDTEYNEGIILYLASLDFISYYDNPDIAMEKVINAINDYKDLLAKKTQEEERIREEEAKIIRKQEEQELIRKQQELQRLERERLDAIKTEKKKREEELNNIYAQLRVIDEEVADWEKKKIQIENEFKTVEHKLGLLEKLRSPLETKRKYLENLLFVKDMVMPSANIQKIWFSSDRCEMITVHGNFSVQNAKGKKIIVELAFKGHNTYISKEILDIPDDEAIWENYMFTFSRCTLDLKHDETLKCEVVLSVSCYQDGHHLASMMQYANVWYYFNFFSSDKLSVRACDKK